MKRSFRQVLLRLRVHKAGTAAAVDGLAYFGESGKAGWCDRASIGVPRANDVPHVAAVACATARCLTSVPFQNLDVPGINGGRFQVHARHNSLP